MLNLKTKPVGVDIPVQKMQSFLYTQLKALWKLNDDNFDGNGRCYREKVDRGYTPRLFVPSDQQNNTVYKDVDFDDTRHAALYFFDVGDQVKQSGGTTVAKVDALFLVNVTRIKPRLEHRGDEEIRNDVQRLCRPSRYGFTMVETVTGFKNVLSRFEALLTADQAMFRDTHPLHVFKIGFELIYQIHAC